MERTSTRSGAIAAANRGAHARTASLSHAARGSRRGTGCARWCGRSPARSAQWATTDRRAVGLAEEAGDRLGQTVAVHVLDRLVDDPVAVARLVAGTGAQIEHDCGGHGQRAVRAPRGRSRRPPRPPCARARRPPSPARRRPRTSARSRRPAPARRRDRRSPRPRGRSRRRWALGRMVPAGRVDEPVAHPRAVGFPTPAGPGATGNGGHTPTYGSADRCQGKTGAGGRRPPRTGSKGLRA